MLLSCFGGVEIAAQLSRMEDRERHRRAHLPHAGGPGEELRQRRALQTEHPRERNPWKERGLRLTDVGVRGDESLLGLTDIRPSFQQPRRQSGRHLRRHPLRVEHGGPRDRPWITSEQDAETILGLRDPTLDVGDRRRGGRELLLRAMHIELRGQAILVAPPYELERRLPRGERAAVDVRLAIELEKIEVCLGDVVDQRGQNGPSVLRAGEEVGPGRLGRAPKSTPQIQLERQINPRAIEVLLRVQAATPGERVDRIERKALSRKSLVRVASLRIDLRELRGARHGKLCPRFGHPSDRQPQIFVFFQRGRDQVAEHGVGKELPPLEIGHRADALTRRTPLLWHRDAGSLVVRADRGAA